jgi:hypothetical protein
LQPKILNFPREKLPLIYFRTIHDSIRDPEELNNIVIGKLDQSTAFLRMFTICRILHEYHPDANMAPSPSSRITPVYDNELNEQIRKYGIDKTQWSKLRLKGNKFKILLCKE